MGSDLTQAESAFLSRFTGRGWLHGARDDVLEAGAVRKALRLKYLRKELTEVHFTPRGRAALARDQEGGERG